MKIEFQVEASHPFDLDYAASRFVEQIKEEVKRYPGSSYKRISSARVIREVTADELRPLQCMWEATYEASFDI